MRALASSYAKLNRYLRERYIADHNRRFARPAREASSAFVAVGRADLEQILCIKEPRTVGRDNCVVFDKLCLQLEKRPERSTCAGSNVGVRRHLDGSLTVWLGSQRLGIFDSRG